MNQYLSKFYHTHIKPYLFPDDYHYVVDDDDDNGTRRHQQTIKDTGCYLEDVTLPIRRRVEAAYNLSMLAYIGGYCCAALACDYIPFMLDLLRDPETGDELIMILLQALSNICYTHLGNKSRSRVMGLVAALPRLLDPETGHSDLTRRWTCYLLDILCSNDVPTIRELRQNHPQLQARLEAMEAEDWSHWPGNHAAILLKVLGFWPPDQHPMAQDSTQKEGSHDDPTGPYTKLTAEDGNDYFS